jgi:HlyD family secretion protein
MTTDTSAPAGAQTEQAGQAEIKGPSRLARRQRIVVGGALALALLSAGGLVASTWVKSPAQSAADTAPPAPSLLTAPVQDTVLSSTVILRGDFAPGGSFQATPTSVAATEGNPGGGPLIVTAVPATAGAPISPGQVVVEYSGRPVYALPGATPAYRDMLPGESGKDITQLQAALTSLGYSCGSDARGFFGAGTKSAVTRFYGHLGYAVPTTGAATALAVTTAQQAYDTQSAVVDAAPAAQRSQAELTLQADAAALASAQAVDGPMVPMSEVVFIPTFPASATSLPVVGQSVASPLLTLVDGGLSLTGQLDPSQAGLVKAGMNVQVYSEATGIQAAGTVADVGESTAGTSSSGSASAGSQDSDSQGSGSSAGAAGQNGAQADADGASGGTYIPLAITPRAPWDPSLDGQDVRITVTAATTGTPVLAVPEAAISTGADARTTVTVVDKHGAQHTVQVRAGVTADGLVQVTAVGGALTTGEQVVVGQ